MDLGREGVGVGELQVREVELRELQVGGVEMWEKWGVGGMGVWEGCERGNLYSKYY